MGGARRETLRLPPASETPTGGAGRAVPRRACARATSTCVGTTAHQSVSRGVACAATFHRFGPVLSTSSSFTMAARAQRASDQGRDHNRENGR